jgi:hypothetical protein
MSVIDRIKSLFVTEKPEVVLPVAEPMEEPASTGEQIHLFVQGIDHTNKQVSLHLWANSMEEGLKTARGNPDLKSITDLTVMPKVELIQKCIRHRNKSWLQDCFNDANTGLVHTIPTSALFETHKKG